MSYTYHVELQDASQNVYHLQTDSSAVSVTHAKYTSTNLYDALTEIYNKIGTSTITLTASNFVTMSGGGYVMNVTNLPIYTTDKVIVNPVLSDTLSTAKSQLDSWCNISRIVCNTNGTLTFYAYDKVPTTNLTLTLIYIR